MGRWDLNRRATAAALVWVFGLLGVTAAAEWLYQSLSGRAPWPAAHGLKILFFAVTFVPLLKLVSRIEDGRDVHLPFRRAVPWAFALIVGVEIVRAFI